MLSVEDINKKNIILSENIVDKTKAGFVFTNELYCKLFSMNVLVHISKMSETYDLSEEQLNKINLMYNKLLIKI